MTREHWHQIEQLLEDARADIDEYLDTMYTVCEEDYCDDSTDDLPHGYEDVWPILPDGNGLSVGDIDRLKEHIEAWKRGE